MENLELELKLTVAHVNTLLKHLANGVYNEVSEVIQMLHTQAKPQIESAVPAAPAAEEAPAVTE